MGKFQLDNMGVKGLLKRDSCSVEIQDNKGELRKQIRVGKRPGLSR